MRTQNSRAAQLSVRRNELKDKTELINIMDFPDELSDSICQVLSNYSVALLRIVIDQNYEKFSLIGSGTLVIVNGRFSILTAEHVLSEIEGSEYLGLLTSYRGNPHRYKFETNQLAFHRIAKGENDSDGPDIGLITLPNEIIGRLKAEKSFFNIDRRRDRFNQGFIPVDRGFWFTLGFPGVFEFNIEPDRGFSEVKGYYGLCGISGIRKEYENDGYDYLEMSIEYESHNEKLPDSFGGVSGGGIWQVPLSRNNQGRLEPDEYILSGVMFYQTQLQENQRFLRGHGRKVIYFNVPEYMEELKNS